MTTLAMPCRNRSHSPRLVAGVGWSCPECTESRTVAEVELPKPGLTSKIPEAERAIFVAALRQAARGVMVRQNDVRPLIRGRIFHKHIGPLWTWAQACGLLVEVRRERSADTDGRNAHHDSGIYELKERAA